MSNKQQGDSKNATSDKTTDPPAPAPPSPYIVQRGKDGLHLIRSFSSNNDQQPSICKDEIVLFKSEDKNNRVESIYCSEDGELLAWCNSESIKVVKFSTQEVVFDQPNTPRSNCLMISPKSNKLVTFNTMSGGDNLHFWDIASQTKQHSMPFKKASQWKPVFSMNEDLCMQHINGELVFYPGCKFDKQKKISHLKINDFSLSTASSADASHSYQHIYTKRIKNKTHYVAIYAVGTKGQPSIVKIYKYPNLTDCITNKSFFKADSVKFSWSPSGNSLLLTCIADFDKTGKSYYGEQTLNYMSVKGDSYFVKLPKEGTISHIEWHPSCDQDMFVCVYGFQPAKVSLFNNKCEIICNFGDQGSFNATLFSPFGNLLAVFGFGNLAGSMCIWDIDKKKLITNVKIPDTTAIQWSADGKHILTCTTFPRLRTHNGFRLWYYTGSLLYERVHESNEVELYDFILQPQPEKYKKPKVDARPPKQPNLLTQSKLSKFQSSAAKYVPPSERNKEQPSATGGQKAPKNNNKNKK